MVGLGAVFKQRDDIFGARMSPEGVRDLLVDDLPVQGLTLSELVDEFTSRILPLCKNEASPRFMGFGDTGDDPAALAGGILAMFTQQNLINQSFDAPSATFVEIAVLVGFVTCSATSTRRSIRCRRCGTWVGWSLTAAR